MDDFTGIIISKHPSFCIPDWNPPLDQLLHWPVRRLRANGVQTRLYHLHYAPRNGGGLEVEMEQCKCRCCRWAYSGVRVSLFMWLTAANRSRWACALACMKMNGMSVEGRLTWLRDSWRSCSSWTMAFACCVPVRSRGTSFRAFLSSSSSHGILFSCGLNCYSFLYCLWDNVARL